MSWIADEKERANRPQGILRLPRQDAARIGLPQAAGPTKSRVETTPLEPLSESRKVYAPGIGLVMDNVLKLVDVIDDVYDD